MSEAAKQIEVSEQTYYRRKTSLWRRKYAKIDKPRLKELEKENVRLKKLAREQTLGIDILKEVIEGKY